MAPEVGLKKIKSVSFARNSAAGQQSIANKIRKDHGISFENDYEKIKSRTMMIVYVNLSQVSKEIQKKNL